MSDHFETLVRRHQGVVCAVAYSVVRDRARSEEIAQEAFLIAWQKLPAMTAPPAMPGWICGIARNLAANAARRRKETAMSADAAAATPSALDQLIDHESELAAERALASLEPADRDVVVLYYRGDGSLADVAATLGITEPAARKRLQRGRDRLRSALAAVETALRATRPGHAFTAACVAALAARGTSAHATPAAKATFSAQWLALVVITGVVATLGVVLWHAHGGSTEPARASVAAAGSAEPSFHRIDPPARAAVVERIAVARASRAQPTPVAPRAAPAAASSAPPVPPPGLPEADKIYDFSGSALDDSRPLPEVPAGTPLTKTVIRRAIRAVQPLLYGCYTDALPRLAGKTGTLQVYMRVVGEPDVGSIVSVVDVVGDAALTADGDFVECLRETLYSIELPAMTTPEMWDVYYPFVVR